MSNLILQPISNHNSKSELFNSNKLFCENFLSIADFDKQITNKTYQNLSQQQKSSSTKNYNVLNYSTNVYPEVKN